MNEIVKFKHLLEYFVAHLEWCQNEDTSILGYQVYIKNLIDNKKFKNTGQGYDNHKIQLQIKEWENYSIGKICINVSGQRGYKSKSCYLNWLGTGINICAKWENSKIKSLYLVEYQYWEENKPRVNLQVENLLSELKLFEEGISYQFKDFFQKYKDYFIKYKQMQNIQNALNTLNLLKYKKQIILQGPPGTGKTREAKKLAKALLNIAEDKNLKSSEQFQIIQFHPSYSYEDFVRGIIAKTNDNGIMYQAENKILAKMAKKAQSALDNHQETPLALTFKEHLIERFILSEKKGFNISENFVIKNITIGIEENEDDEKIAIDYEVKIKGEWIEQKIKNLCCVFNQEELENGFQKHSIKDENAYWNDIREYFKIFAENQPKKIHNHKNFVLIIDEINRANLSSVLGELIYALEYRGEAIDSMYEVDGSNKITLPPNLYIIGTMNTADRSVGHIDYAIRRRFAFVDILPRDLSSELGDKFDSERFKEVEKLFNDHLSQEFKKEEVQLGHSYFITEKIDIQTRLEYEIKPILREYVKDGVLKESAISEIKKL